VFHHSPIKQKGRIGALREVGLSEKKKKRVGESAAEGIWDHFKGGNFIRGAKGAEAAPGFLKKRAEFATPGPWLSGAGWGFGRAGKTGRKPVCRFKGLSGSCLIPANRMPRQGRGPDREGTGPRNPTGQGGNIRKGAASNSVGGGTKPRGARRGFALTDFSGASRCRRARSVSSKGPQPAGAGAYFKRRPPGGPGGREDRAAEGAW